MNELGCHSANGRTQTAPVTDDPEKRRLPSVNVEQQRPQDGQTGEREVLLVASIRPAAQLARTGPYDMRKVVKRKHEQRDRFGPPQFEHEEAARRREQQHGCKLRSQAAARIPDERHGGHLRNQL
jgi:hypothetical protein